MQAFAEVSKIVGYLKTVVRRYQVNQRNHGHFFARAGSPVARQGQREHPYRGE
jgi:hypothetical protein